MYDCLYVPSLGGTELKLAVGVVIYLHGISTERVNLFPFSYHSSSVNGSLGMPSPHPLPGERQLFVYGYSVG